MAMLNNQRVNCLVTIHISGKKTIAVLLQFMVGTSTCLGQVNINQPSLWVITMVHNAGPHRQVSLYLDFLQCEAPKISKVGL